MLSSIGGARAPPSIEIGYVTDVEGNLEYFDRWVARSGVLKYTQPNTLDLTHDNAYFVFGGDAMDRGDGGLRFTRRLVELKKKHPKRVFLLAGNRDLNKVRFTSEFSEDDLKRDSETIPGPHWDPSAPTLHAYLTEVAAARGEAGGAATVDSRTERMHYYLKHTLGCPNTFEGRRRELAVLGEAAEPVSDTAVVDSLVGDILPGGALRTYLEHACIACVLGNTIFVHGAIDANVAGLVPEDSTRFTNPAAPQPMRRVHDVHEWTRELNGVMQRGLAANLAQPGWDATRTTRGGEVLIALQNRCAMYGRCVVSCCYADGGTITTDAATDAREQVREKFANGAADALLYERWLSDPRNTEVAEWLQGAGIRRIVVGHKPSGDAPAVLSAAHNGVEVISADTSYGDPTDRELGRGVSLAGVCLMGQSLEVNHAKIYGTLADGREHEAHLATLDSRGRAHDTPGDELLGTELDGGWWVKARAVAAGSDPGKQTYVAFRGAGRTVEQMDHLVSRL